jgi:hypothetical protein
VGQRRLPEARRAVEKDVIERFPPFSRGLEEDRQIVFDTRLADVLPEPLRTEILLERVFVTLRPTLEDSVVVGHGAVYP